MDRQAASGPGVDGLHTFATLEATHHIRLIGHHDQQIAGLPKHPACFVDARQYLAFVLAGRWVRHAIPHDYLVDHTIPVKKHGSPHRTDSHFVSDRFSAGCETSKCQTTA